MISPPVALQRFRGSFSYIHCSHNVATLQATKYSGLPALTCGPIVATIGVCQKPLNQPVKPVTQPEKSRSASDLQMQSEPWLTDSQPIAVSRPLHGREWNCSDWRKKSNFRWHPCQSELDYNDVGPVHSCLLSHTGDVGSTGTKISAPTGLEPAPDRLRNGCSFQLSYGAIPITGSRKLPVIGFSLRDRYSGPYSVTGNRGFLGHDACRPSNVGSAVGSRQQRRLILLRDADVGLSMVDRGSLELHKNAQTRRPPNHSLQTAIDNSVVTISETQTTAKNFWADRWTA